MDWSTQQNEAITAVDRWLRDPYAGQVFRLFGFAGCGKTTIAKAIADNANTAVRFACFTGKASLVLRSKGCRDAGTIHGLIYRVEEGPGGKPIFTLNAESPLARGGLLIIDEVSMVDEELALDLLSFGCRVLVLGDPAQLPPVKGTGYFINAEPDFMLTEVHRQAANNPIIRMSMDLRAGKPLTVGAYGDSRVLRRRDLGQSTVLAADQIIVGTNKTRRGVNAKVRGLLGFEDRLPEQSDRLICLRNNKEKDLLNGGMWEVSEAWEVDDGIVKMEVMSIDNPDHTWPLEIVVPQEFFLGTEDTLDYRTRRDYDEFDYGNAITCHKAQGSQYSRVCVFDESASFREHAKRWGYTALTRAADRIDWILM
jgi:exodeoxyribonuclease-5